MRECRQPLIPPNLAERRARLALVAVKLAHTVAWAFFAGCILAIPVVSWRGHHRAAAWLIGIVFVEVAILVVNGWRCPLTVVAARYTEERRDNFDIYLPEWLARHNKLIFGVLFCLGLAYAVMQWLGASTSRDSPVTAIESSLQSYYAARAPEYDRVYAKPERQRDIGALQAWLPALFDGARVLEVACGTGYWTPIIASRARALVAIDGAAETLAIARSRVAQDHVSFLVGDAYRLPHDQGEFDAAFAGFWFSHVPKQRQRAFLRGLSAALTPGATIVLVDNLYVEGSNHPIAERDADGNTFQRRKLDDGSLHRVLKNFPTEAELRELTDAFGRDLSFTRLEYYWAARYTAVRP